MLVTLAMELLAILERQLGDNIEGLKPFISQY